MCQLERLEWETAGHLATFVDVCSKKSPDVFAVCLRTWSELVRDSLKECSKPIRYGWMAVLHAYAKHEPSRCVGAGGRAGGRFREEGGVGGGGALRTMHAYGLEALACACHA